MDFLASIIIYLSDDADKDSSLPIARKLNELNFKILATRGTAFFLQNNGIKCERVYKISEGRPHILDKIHDNAIQWIFNTSMGTRTTEDSYFIRRAALDYHLPYTTTCAGAEFMVRAINTMRKNEPVVKSIQEYHFK